MSEPRVLRIAMNGITGRMGYRQHLLRSILPIRDQGGVTLPDGTRVTVEPILVGRNEAKVAELARRHGVEHWTTDLDAVIEDPTVDVVFDASMTSLRAETLKKAMRAGKHVYTEKPTAETLDEAVELAQIAQERGVTAGARILGVNVRNLKTLDVDPARYAALADGLPEDVVRVAESGVESDEQIKAYAAAGADVVLVGEALVRHGAPEEALRAFRAASLTVR